MRKVVFSFLLALLVPMMAGAQEMYAVYDGAETFTFYYDNDRASRSGTAYDLTTDGDTRLQWYGADWKENVTKAVFDASFADARPTTTRYWFEDFRNMTEIEGMEYLNTSEVKDMRRMFYRCNGLTSLDLTGFKTDNVTDMSYMFVNCYGLTSLDVTGFKTDNVTRMDYMFDGCSRLTSLDVTGFKTDNVTDMGYMFGYCFGLTSLDVTGFKTDNVTDMGGMFAECSGLTTIYCNDDWNADGRGSKEMFIGCTSLAGGAGTAYNKRKINATMAHPDAENNPGYFTRKDDGGEGDANGDGTVNAADIVEVVNSIMNNPSEKYNDKAADANGDGVVNAADIVAIVNKIMGL